MPAQPLRLAMLWHQHQPYYKLGSSYLLPWARLHATKDYYDIGAALEAFPTIRQTINVVPSLLLQLVDYAERGASDHVLDLSRRPASELTLDEKVGILRTHYLCNVERMILPYPRYAELYARGNVPRNDIDRARAVAETFAERDWLDLQVWYNLTWIGDYSRAEEPFATLLARARDFSEADKEELLEASLRIIAKAIPTYRRLMESGQAEISVTPFYHPILPVVCDSFSALEATPNASLPEHHIAYPEDATRQVERAIELYEHHFGRKPNGLWPSEGSVSDQALALVRGAGINWVATDEGILRKTLGEDWRPLSKYYPYRLKTKNGPIWTIFRDHELSDAIGFVYSSWDPAAAALDFYNRLIEIRTRLIQEHGPASLRDAVVPVILDGENCWEFYKENGRPFLEALYGLLSESQEIVTTTMSEALADAIPTPERTRGRIYAGSWIGSNFKIWIGHEEDNRAWDALAEAREHLMGARDRLSDETFAEAMEEIYIAEGSDWFWWYGDENTTANQEEFDALYRMHLRNVYVVTGSPAPEYLNEPFRTAHGGARLTPPRGTISPTVDGLRSSEIEWRNAGYFTAERQGGAMHHADLIERRFWFGTDSERLYLRFDAQLPIAAGGSICITVVGSSRVALHFGTSTIGIEVAADDEGRIAVDGISAALAETLEIAIPLGYIADERGEAIDVGIVCEIFEGGHQTERFPQQGEIRCPLMIETAID